MSHSPSPKRARREVGLMRADDAGFVGSASGIHFVRTVYRAASKDAPPVSAVPGEEDQLAETQATIPLWREEEITSHRNNDIIADSQDLLQLSQSYFDHWHPAFPFLHAPTIVQWLREVAKLPTSRIEDTLGPRRLSIIRSIMSIATMDRRQAGSVLPVPLILLHANLQDILRPIQDILVQRPSIDSLQAILSSQLLLISMLRLNAASRLHGLTIRFVLHLGLHRCSARFAHYSTSNASLRQRLFWSAYVLDRFLAQALGMPVMLRDDDIDVCHLNEEIHEQAVKLPVDPRLTFCYFLAEHARLKGETIDLCNKSISHRASGSENTTALNIKIAAWANQVDELFDTTPDHELAISSTQKVILQVSKHELSLSLHRPLLTAAPTSADYGAAIQTCIAASRSIITTLYRFLKHDIGRGQSSASSQVLSSATMFWPSFTWSLWMSDFIVFYAAMRNEMSAAAALKLVGYSNEIFQHLAQRGNHWPEACAAVIRELSRRIQLNEQRCETVELPRTPSEPSRLLAPDNFDTPDTAHSRASRGTRVVRSTQEGNHLDSISPGSGHLVRSLPLSGSNSTRPLQTERLPEDNQALNGTDLDSTGLFFGDPLSSDLEAWFADVAAQAEVLDKDISTSVFEGFDIPFWMDDSAHNIFPGSLYSS